MDIVGVLGNGLQMGSPLAFPLAFLAGAVTSVGPCAASRVFAVGAYATRSRRPMLIAFAFVGGLVAAHVPIGILAWYLRDVFLSIGRYTTYVNIGMAIILVTSGLVMIVRAQPHDHLSHEANHPENDAVVLPARSMAAVFALGVTFAIALGPCCAPPIMAIIAGTTFVGKPVLGIVLLCVFAVGHAAPVLFLGPVMKVIDALSDRLAVQQVVSVASGAFLVFVGWVYALCV